ncbi:FAD-binding oxidoreductase [Streptosporangium sp. G11]|uniref:FAD-binding oxidoreductase n=1 Tax=Streptosporangium sp. G11 TaxID=3436926 RepID=UPI003EBAA877
MNTLNALRSVIRGRVWLPGDPGFDGARRPWNLAIEQPVAAVVEVADAEDVAALVRHARSAGLAIAAQPNGHEATGRTDGTILLRTGRLETLEVDPVARRARVGASVPSGRVQAAAAPYGLTGLPGSSPVVSVAGVALGGGLSWFGRMYGWVADSVTAFDIVDSQGRQRHVTAGTDPDLFWALRRRRLRRRHRPRTGPARRPAPVRRPDVVGGRARAGRDGRLPADHRRRPARTDGLAGPAALPGRRPHGGHRRHLPGRREPGA